MKSRHFFFRNWTTATIEYRVHKSLATLLGHDQTDLYLFIHSPSIHLSKRFGRTSSMRSLLLPILRVAACVWRLSTINAFVLTSSIPRASPRLFLGGAANKNDCMERPSIAFPGGGLYFYWQAGVICFLRENGYDLSSTTFCGASAGALVATLTATEVDFYRTTQLALDLSEKMGVWDRSQGLQGVWGQTIEDWLEELLPEDAVEKAQRHDLTLLVTRIPSFQKERVHEFVDRDDLIRCNRASVHIPWFLDGKLTIDYRGKTCIDGSFMVDKRLFLPRQQSSIPTIWLDHKMDPAFQKTTLLDAVNLVEPTAIWTLLEQGKAFGRSMSENSEMFDALPRTRKPMRFRLFA